MLFVVQECAIDALRAGQPHAPIAFSRLLSNHADGHHVVLMDPKSCRAIEEDPGFSADDKATARNIRNRYADYGALPDLLASHVRVFGSGGAPAKNGSVWDVPLRWISQNPLREALLHGEDLYDIAVFEAAAEDFLAEHRLHSFRVRAQAQPGGGGNTHRVLAQNAVVRQLISVCVVDSDRLSPSSGIGATAVPCLAVTGPGLYQVEVTDGRSLENSLPWRLIDIVKPTKVPLPSKELAVFQAAVPDAPRFLNFKKGINGYDMSRLTGGDAAYWAGAAAKISGASSCCNPTCQAKDQPTCGYKPWSGFGGSLLGEAGQWLADSKGPKRYLRYLPSPNDQDWRRIGAIVGAFSIGAGARRI